MWVARDENNTLTLFKSKPVRSGIRMTNKTKGDCEYGKTTKCDYWDEAAIFDGYDKWVNLNEYFEIDESLFPDLKWEDEPIEVDIVKYGLQEKQIGLEKACEWLTANLDISKRPCHIVMDFRKAMEKE